MRARLTAPALLLLLLSPALSPALAGTAQLCRDFDMTNPPREAMMSSSVSA